MANGNGNGQSLLDTVRAGWPMIVSAIALTGYLAVTESGTKNNAAAIASLTAQHANEIREIEDELREVVSILSNLRIQDARHGSEIDRAMEKIVSLERRLESRNGG